MHLDDIPEGKYCTDEEALLAYARYITAQGLTANEQIVACPYCNRPSIHLTFIYYRGDFYVDAVAKGTVLLLHKGRESPAVSWCGKDGDRVCTRDAYDGEFYLVQQREKGNKCICSWEVLMREGCQCGGK